MSSTAVYLDASHKYCKEGLRRPVETTYLGRVGRHSISYNIMGGGGGEGGRRGGGVGEAGVYKYKEMGVGRKEEEGKGKRSIRALFLRSSHRTAYPIELCRGARLFGISFFSLLLLHTLFGGCGEGKASTFLGLFLSVFLSFFLPPRSLTLAPLRFTPYSHTPLLLIGDIWTGLGDGRFD